VFVPLKGSSLENKKLELESQIQILSMLFQVLKGDWTYSKPFYKGGQKIKNDPSITWPKIIR